MPEVQSCKQLTWTFHSAHMGSHPPAAAPPCAVSAPLATPGYAQAPAGLRPVRCAGRGAFGEVWLMEHELTGRSVAVKMIERRRINRARARLVLREVLIHRQLRHAVRA